MIAFFLYVLFNESIKVTKDVASLGENLGKRKRALRVEKRHVKNFRVSEKICPQKFFSSFFRQTLDKKKTKRSASRREQRAGSELNTHQRERERERDRLFNDDDKDEDDGVFFFFFFFSDVLVAFVVFSEHGAR